MFIRNIGSYKNHTASEYGIIDISMSDMFLSMSYAGHFTRLVLAGVKTKQKKNSVAISPRANYTD
jgi:hypothetical protein